jgi:hypothetical protein
VLIFENKALGGNSTYPQAGVSFSKLKNVPKSPASG